MKIQVNCCLLTITIIILTGCLSKTYNNSPQFHGINGLGIAPANATPPLELIPDKNLAWKTPLSKGVSSPCIYGDKIFLTGFNQSDSTLVTFCMNKKSGSILWERAVSPDSLENCHEIGSPAATTPVTDGKAVYVFFGSYGVLSYNFEGTILWERKLPVNKTLYGACASPVLHDSLLILNIGGLNEQKPSLFAINCQTGKTVWEKILYLKNGPSSNSNASPEIWRDQVIIHSAGGLTSINLKDGSSRWTYPTTTSGTSTPVIVNDVLFVNCFSTMGESRLINVLPDYDTMVKQYDSNQNGLVDISEIPKDWAVYRRPELE